MNITVIITLFFSSAQSPDGKSLEENVSERCTAPLGRHKVITCRKKFNALPAALNILEHIDLI